MTIEQTESLSTLGDSAPVIKKKRGRPPRHENPRAMAEKARERGLDGERVPLGVPHLKLTVRDYQGQLQGYVGRWINDKPGRIQRAIQGGYMPVYRDALEVGEGEDYNPDQSTWVCQEVGTQESGQPLRAYLMKIKEAWYNEDQAKKQQSIDDIDRSILGGQINEQSGDGRYVKQVSYNPKG